MHTNSVRANALSSSGATHFLKTEPSMSAARVGLEAMGLAVPGQYVDMTELAEARGVAPGKYLEGIGLEQMAVPSVGEDTVTLMRARAALQGVDVSDIGLCIVGTGTAVDHSKPVASFVQGLLGLPTTSGLRPKHAL